MSDVSERVGALSPGERAALAMRLARAARAGGAAAESAITRRRDGSPPAPLSFAQQRLWFLSQMEADSTTYNLPVTYELLGTLDVPTLERGLNEIIRRHEVLRTTFTIRDGEPVQVVAPTLKLGLPVVDLTHLSGTEQWEELSRRANEYAGRPFDLERGPLVRASLLKLSDEAHYLFVLMHHIVGDAWSMGIIMNELSALYRAFLAGEPSPLAELAVQYADFAVWQREWLAADAMQRQLDYWKRKLGGATSVLQLPTDHPRPSVPTQRGGSQFLLLPEAVSRAVKELSQREGATLFMTLLAAFDVLLYRYTGQTDISVGTPLAGRSRPEAEPLIGLFINPVVLRTNLSGNPSFRELLGRVREEMLEAHANQDVPFEKLVAELQPERTAAQTPLFQVMFILQNAPMNESASSADLVISLGKLGVDTGTAKFDLTLSLEEISDERLLSYWDYKTDLFEHATVTRMFGHFRALLEAVVAAPDRRLSEIAILDEAERRQLLVETNATAAPFDVEVCAHELFEAQAARTPEAIALVLEATRVTYGELNARANQLARHLRRLGVKPGNIVGIHLERSIEMIVGLLAVLKAGGAYVPLDPAYPAARIQFMLENSRARLLLTVRRLADSLPAGQHAGVVCLDAARQAIEDESGENLTRAATPSDLAYVIYTSGSTGQPKGVMIEHRSLCNFAGALSRVFDIRPESRVLQFAPFSFDASVSEVFTTLSNGATLVLAPQTSLLPGPALIELLREQSVTAVLLPPAALAAMPDAELEALRTLIVGGDECPPEVARRWAAGRRFINAYGPTEATICAAAAMYEAFADRLPVGRPIRNTEIYLLDDDGQPVPVIVPGELHIGGVALARGYLNQPALTAEKFVPHPFSRQPGARLYKTGDLARFRPDGQIEVLGRRDRQAKVRGFRIEPGEIEAALVAHPDVREAAVVTREESPSQKRLVAYTVAAGERAPDADALRSHLRARLPVYMIPSAFVALDALPLTPSGKVDRQRLPAPGGARPELGQGYVAPRTELEKMLAEMWQSVLRVSEVGVHDNFFDLGGDSIHAAIFINSLQKRLGVVVYVVALFDAPNIAALAAHLEERHAATLPAHRELTPIRPLARDGARQFPLSFAQQRLWFIDRLTLDSAFYNIPQAIRLNGRLDVPSLERSLNEILRRHEALRTSMTDSGGRPVQVVHEPATLSLPLTDLTRVPEGVREREAVRLAVEEGHRPFDLSAAPLMRAGLLRLGEQEHILLVTTHHIVSDGWSAGIFLRELSALYGAFLRGEPSPLAELPVQYADFAVWQREWLQGEVLEEQLDYWKQRLGGELPVLKLPTDRPRPPALSYRGAEQSLELPAELTGRLKSFSRHEGATLFMTLLAAFDALLHRYTEQEEIIVGTPIAGRNRREVEGLIGFFVNTLVMRATVAGATTFRELLGQVREATLGAYAHQEVPFEKLVEELHPKRDTSRNPLFQVMFALQNAPLEDLTLPGLALASFDISNDMTRFDLEFHLWEHGETLGGTLIYNTDLFDAATVAQMLGHFRNLLESGVASPDARISELPLLTEAERRRLLYEWNDTRREYPRESCVHELFEAQAARTPDATAVVSDDGRITYRELNERANRLARYLRRRGVTTESSVGVCLERGAELVIGLLGVLKAGGVCVPLDPEYPKPRLRFMMEDAGVRVLLTGRQKPGALPADGVEIICPDDGAEIDGESAENLRREAAADNLAYVIYTSGSTGRPKGVCIAHRAITRLVCNTNYVELLASDRVAQVSTASFDAAIFEIWGALLHGAQLHVVSREVAISPQEFAAQIREQGITTLFLTTALFNQLARLRPDALAPLSHLLFGGEAVDAERVRELLSKGAPRRLLHVYGPTENTTFSTWHHVVEVSQAAHTVPIGRPVTNTEAYVLGSDLRPVPAGVAGELFLGGEGLMRGYLNRPAATAEKLVPHPYTSAPGARLYRTGDLVRLLHDGSIEFLERIDRQVKVRGFRIELGEIEAAIAEHPSVGECVVLAREDEQPGERRLVAYVVNRAEDFAPAEEESANSLSSGQVEHWQKIFDDHIYSKPSTQPDPTFNIVGWNSTYTDEPLPAVEMRAWLEDTLEPVRAAAPRRVLEIGCGTGLLLSRLAPSCEHYTGTDVSQVALDYVRQQVRWWDEGQARVSLLQRAADDFEGIEPQGFDAVILNSVVQYFPDADYLRRVLEGAARAVRPGGLIYIGDVRSLPLLETFHASVQLFRAQPSLPAAQLRELARTRAAQENELAVAPAFFYALAQHLPEVARVEVRPKRGHFHNELTRFRYQVLIHVGGETEPATDAAPWLDWDTEALTLDALRRRLAEERPLALGLSNVPNARLSAEVKILEELSDEENGRTAGELRRIVDEHAAQGVDPEELYALGDELAYSVEISWARHGGDGRFDVLLRARDASSAALPKAVFPAPESRAGDWKEYANNPLRRAVARELIPRLRAHLQERLPDYMLPSAFVMLDALPLNANGKVDRRALPAPDTLRPEMDESYVAPRGAVEEQVAAVWRQVLGIARVGVHDNFFDLGGHSLIATQVVSRLCDTFGLELPLRQLFESPTVAGLAAAVVRRQAEQSGDELLAQALAELEGLSEDEVQAMLEEDDLPSVEGEE